MVSVFSLNSGEPVSSMCSASARLWADQWNALVHRDQGYCQGLVQRTLMIRSSADQIASVSVCLENSMHMGLFYEDVGTLEMCEHLYGYQNPRDCS